MKIFRQASIILISSNSFTLKNALAFTSTPPRLISFKIRTFQHNRTPLDKPSSYIISSKKTTKSNDSSSLHVRLTPEEIEASLGPDRKIASKPFTWKELTDIVKNGDPTMHSRSIDVQEQYLLHTIEIKQTWRSMNDFILYSKFQTEKKMDEDGFKYVSYPCLEDLKSEKRIEKRLLLNEYPYYVCNDIEHWCLWKLGGKVTREEVDDAITELKDMNKINDDNREQEVKDVLSWINPPHLQSIPDIDHAHILVYLKSQ